MFSGESNYKIEKKDRALIPLRFHREPKRKTVLSLGIGKRVTTYPLPEWKTPAICNLLVRKRFDNFGAEQAARRQG